MTSWGDSGIPRREPKRNARSLGGALRAKFREVMKRLADRAPAPAARARRRSSGETTGAFRLAADAILRPISQLPFVAHAAAFLYDAFTWLHLWERNEDTDQHDVTAGLSGSDDNHLSPRL